MCRVQLLDVYAEFFPSLYTYMQKKEQEVTSLLDFFTNKLYVYILRKRFSSSLIRSNN